MTVGGESVVDLWGGWSDAARTRPWERDTIVIVASTTKGLTGLCGNMLIDRGLLDPKAPVAQYWPEFAQNGKERVLVEHCFNHTAGLPNMPRGWRRRLGRRGRRLWRRSRPTGSRAPPTATTRVTYGYLIGELITRITG